jgi:hypothetical protein
MIRRVSAFPRLLSSAFTLLEVLVAVAIMTTAMALVAMIYSNTIRAWRLGQSVMDELHQGDFIVEQVVGALRSTAFFQNNPKVYGFWLNDQGTQSSAHDEISFVTSSSAFLPSDSPMQNTLHRLFITIDSDKEGHEGLAVRAVPHMVKEMDKNKAEPWIVSSRVKAIDCQVYDFTEKRWSDDWEHTNRVPNLVKIAITVKPVHEEDPPLEITRVIEIPIAAATGSASVASSAAGVGTNAGTVAIGPGGLLPSPGPNLRKIPPLPGQNAGRNNSNTPRMPTPMSPGTPRPPSSSGGRK